MASNTKHPLQTNYEKAFVKKINSLCYQQQLWQVWSDFIIVVAIGLANSVDICGKVHDRREKEYQECCKRLGGNDNIGELFGYLVQALEENPEQDFLGGLYMNLDLGSHWHGQFFTPYSICQAMADVNIGDSPKRKEDGFISIIDPACGAGATLIAAANKLKQSGINYQIETLFIGQDIDRIVGLMCYIQLSLLGCAGYVAIANSLTNPVKGADVLIPAPNSEQEIWYTPMFASEIWTARRLKKAFTIL